MPDKPTKADERGKTGEHHYTDAWHKNTDETKSHVTRARLAVELVDKFVKLWQQYECLYNVLLHMLLIHACIVS